MHAPAVLGAGMAAAGEAGWRGARGGTGHRSAAGPATVTAGYGGGGPLPLSLRPFLRPSTLAPLPQVGRHARMHSYATARTSRAGAGHRPAPASPRARSAQGGVGWGRRQGAHAARWAARWDLLSPDTPLIAASRACSHACATPRAHLCARTCERWQLQSTASHRRR